MFEEMMKFARRPAKEKSTVQEKAGKPSPTSSLMLDDVDSQSNKIAVFQEQAIASEALGMLSQWFETAEDELEPGEGLGDRLMSFMVAVADDNQDGELDDDEQEVVNVALNAAYDYLTGKGVSEDNAATLLETFDNELARNVHAFILSKLPEGEAALAEDMDKLVFSAEENDPVFDDAFAGHLELDAAYRKVFAIRNGKRLRIKKRISGKVRLSAAQRTAIRKAQRRANTGAAKMRRLKSFRIRRRMGM